MLKSDTLKPGSSCIGLYGILFPPGLNKTLDVHCSTPRHFNYGVSLGEGVAPGAYLGKLFLVIYLEHA